MVSCLDTYILLQCQYNIIEMLLQGQRNNRCDDKDDVIVDALSIERNYILVKTHIIGGPHERKIPKRQLNSVCTKLMLIRHFFLDLIIFHKRHIGISLYR